MRVFVFLTTILILNLFHAPFLPGAPKTHFCIVYTNDVMGEVEPCG